MTFAAHITAQPAGAIGEAGRLPPGFMIERDQDDDPILIPPANVTIFSEPGEGWLVTDYFMQGRDWSNDADVISACCEYLRSINWEG